MGGQVNSQRPSGHSPGSEGKWQEKLTSLLLELTLEELVVFLCHKYYSIFLLQQETSAQLNTVVISNMGILIHFS
jgi:hypothetical protein